jgi:hypothetical protein
MAIVYTWSIDGLECVPSKGGKANVVSNVHWRLAGIDGNYSTSIYGSSSIPYNEDGSFVPFNDLTKSQVLGWLVEFLGEQKVSELEGSIANQIDNLKNPPLVNMPPPWVNG